MGLIADLQATIAAAEARNTARLAEVQAASEAGLTAETSLVIAAYQADLSIINSASLTLGEYQVEAAGLAVTCAADAAAEAGVLSDIESAWTTFAEKVGAGIKFSRDSGARASRYRDLTAVMTYGRGQTDPNLDKVVFGDMERSIQEAVAATASEVVRVTLTVPAQVL